MNLRQSATVNDRQGRGKIAGHRWFQHSLAVACRIILDWTMRNESHEWERQKDPGPIRKYARDHAMSDRRDDLLGVGKAAWYDCTGGPVWSFFFLLGGGGLGLKG